MNDRWEFNGPEEGDQVDLSIVLMFDGEEIIEITESGDHTTEQRKEAARQVCEILNRMEAIAI